jgi:rod shape determining protein RodA
MLSRRLNDTLRRFDWLLFAAVILLAAIGLAALYSLSLSQANPDFYNFKKQLIFLGLGLIGLFGASFVNYSAFRTYSRTLFLGSIGLLVAVLIFGVSIRGTHGWFGIGGFGIQPVELAKFALIIFLAKFFANRFQQFNETKHIVVSLLATVILVSLVVLQPDLGSALILSGIWFILLLLTGIKWRYVVAMFLIFAVLAVSLWSFVLAPYQQDRLISFIHPELDAQGRGYNVAQAMIAIGAGGVFGRGLGFGSQSQLRFIPEAQTDFIFAVVAEELGLVGVAFFLALWAVIFLRLVKIAGRARDDFGMFLALGVAALFFLHVFVNVGMNLGLLPVTGISLPFLSSGGSFLIMSLIMVGAVESVYVRR